MKNKNILSLKEAAEYLNISYRTALNLVKKASLPFFRIGGQWRIRKDDLEQQIYETKRRPLLGQKHVYFKDQVLNRYRKEPQYYIEEEQFSGRFGLRQAYITGTSGMVLALRKIADVRYQRVALAGGVMAVVLEDDYYKKTVGRVSDEYQHWHNYRIHTPRLSEDSRKIPLPDIIFRPHRKKK